MRCSAGDVALGRRFTRAVQPHVYTEQMNFAAIKTALLAREKMHTRRRRLPALEPPGPSINLKIDPGGIRDIEFLVQCLQRVYGGREPWLRSGGTLFSLQKLHDKDHVSGKEFHELSQRLRISAPLGAPPATSPGPADSPPARDRIQPAHPAALDGGVCSGRIPQGRSGHDRAQRMAAVAEIYRRIIYQQQAQSHQEIPDAPFELRGTFESGAADQSSQQILERLAADSPALDRDRHSPDLSPQARTRLFRFLWSAFASSERYATVLRNPEAVARAVVLFEASDYLSDVLVRHPEEIATLSDLAETSSRAASGYLFESPLGLGRTAGDPVFRYLAETSAPYSEKLSLLRQHYGHRVFAAGARDITELREVYTSLAATTAAAEDAIAAAFTLRAHPEAWP